MKTKQLTFLLVLTFLFLFSSSSVVFANDLQDGWDALKRKDYETTIRLWSPLAEQGNLEAQYWLGGMYEDGRGVPQDHQKAFSLFSLASEQGFSYAQYNLGVMYYNGQGVPQDYALAHMWLNICGSTGSKDCVKNRNIVENKMTPSQIEKAQEMARNWKPKKK